MSLNDFRAKPARPVPRRGPGPRPKAPKDARGQIVGQTSIFDLPAEPVVRPGLDERGQLHGQTDILDLTEVTE